MRVLHLLRHAKSSWSDPALADVDRPLAGRGKRSCKRMAPALVEAGCCFEAVYCSPARRARSTLKRIIKTLERDVHWETVDRLYTFDGREVIEFCSTLPDYQPEVLIVGHNPAITELANRLGNRPIDNVPTCGYVAIELQIDRWRDLGNVPDHDPADDRDNDRYDDEARGVTRAFVFPKMLTD